MLRRSLKRQRVHVVYPNVSQAQRDARSVCSYYWETASNTDDAAGKLFLSLEKIPLSLEEMEEVRDWIPTDQSDLAGRKCEELRRIFDRKIERLRARDEQKAS